MQNFNIENSLMIWHYITDVQYCIHSVLSKVVLSINSNYTTVSMYHTSKPEAAAGRAANVSVPFWSTFQENAVWHL